MIKILIVNNYKVLGEGVSRLLDSEPRFVVEMITSIDQVSEKIHQVAYDVCVIDLNVLEKSGIELATEISLVQPGIKILISGREDFAPYFNTLIDKGICGFINYSFSQEQMVMAIKQVVSDQVMIPLKLLKTLRRAKNEVSLGDGRFVSLSPLQEDILHMVSKGMTNDDIAEKLFMSRRNVERHLTTVYRELGVKSRVAAVQFAQELGLIASKMI